MIIHIDMTHKYRGIRHAKNRSVSNRNEADATVVDVDVETRAAQTQTVRANARPERRQQ